MKNITFKCIEITQPIGTFYSGAINFDDLIDISWADVRGLESRQRDVEIYSGIQRELSKSRVKEIEKYVNLVDATFPTAVILAVSSADVEYKVETHEMKVRKDQNVAKILDGQHRIAGLKNCEYSGNKFQINVVLFIDMELEDQALTFATINKSHTKVNKSLVADLFDFATTRSPQKTAHNIVRALNEKKSSPFYEKIKVLGVADDKQKETITQATFVDSLINYISRDAMSDRDTYKRGKKPEKVIGLDAERYFLRNMFIDEKDPEIAQILINYFSVVAEKWPLAWAGGDGLILNKSTGFIALMKFLKNVYKKIGKPEQVPTKQEFETIFSKININDTEFTRQNYLPGQGGISDMYKQFLVDAEL